jgi:hypothetical protein
MKQSFPTPEIKEIDFFLIYPVTWPPLVIPSVLAINGEKHLRIFTKEQGLRPI